MIPKEECKKFETCGASLCPMDPNPSHYWYCDGEVCTLHPEIPFVTKQKQLRSILKKNPHFFFTRKMIESIPKITNKLVGLTCDGYSDWREQEWIKEVKNSAK